MTRKNVKRAVGAGILVVLVAGPLLLVRAKWARTPTKSGSVRTVKLEDSEYLKVEYQISDPGGDDLPVIRVSEIRDGQSERCIAILVDKPVKVFGYQATGRTTIKLTGQDQRANGSFYDMAYSDSLAPIQFKFWDSPNGMPILASAAATKGAQVEITPPVAC